ncbi:MAG TPA: hypothetical protein VFP56_03025 [Candidatus Limnocylindrales bacterium]|nr:hypothetical protein [Candidatus Limnocylindrales bacterium]
MATQPSDPTPADRARPDVRPDVDYKGAPLDAEKGPGLGCFWIQMVSLVVAIFLTPLSVVWNWPVLVTIVIFAAMLVLLLFVGQTVIFLLRLVAADRRADARRRPLRSQSKTVGEIEDEARQDEPGDAARDGQEPDREGVRE